MSCSTRMILSCRDITRRMWTAACWTCRRIQLSRTPGRSVRDAESRSIPTGKIFRQNDWDLDRRMRRRGYVVIAPEHLVSGHRLPSEEAYETGYLYKKYPKWTWAGKFTYEHSIAIDVLETLNEIASSLIPAPAKHQRSRLKKQCSSSNRISGVKQPQL